MNDFLLCPPKRYKALVWLSVNEFAYSVIHLPGWASGEANREALLSGAIKTAISGFDSTTLDSFPWYDRQNAAFKNYVAAVLDQFGQRYREHFLVSYDADASDAEKADAVEKALWVLLGCLAATYDRYAPILASFDEKKASLTGRISSASGATSRFNDTPQDGGLYADDSHTTNVTQTEATSETDAQTPAMRLEEIRRYWRNVMREWVDEIGKITLEGDNL